VPNLLVPDNAKVAVIKAAPEPGSSSATSAEPLVSRTPHQSLKPDGAWMVVEPMAGDRLEDNLNPGGRL
jgi:hypothetical protein